MQHAQGEAVVQLAARDGARALATLTLAFSADPMARWAWPTAEIYLDRFPVFVGAFVQTALKSQRVYAVESLRAVAVWLAPGEEPDENLFDELVKGMDPTLRKNMGAMFAQMERAHPSEPHWFLPLVGVDPTAQGRGLGSQVLAPVLDECDRTCTLAYLESSNPRNIPLYERLGFQITGRLQQGSSPTLTTMLRRPRRAP